MQAIKSKVGIDNNTEWLEVAQKRLTATNIDVKTTSL